MKTCFKCHEEKPETEFYAHGMMGDGRLGKCKECTKADVRANYRKNREHYRAYEKKRFQENPARREAAKLYLKTENGKKSSAAAKRKWAENNKDKRAAHVILGNAIKSGRILKPKECQKCGASDVRIHGHHHDYAKPLDVTWLCVPCHAKEHWN